MNFLLLLALFPAELPLVESKSFARPEQEKAMADTERALKQRQARLAVASVEAEPAFQQWLRGALASVGARPSSGAATLERRLP